MSTTIEERQKKMTEIRQRIYRERQCDSFHFHDTYIGIGFVRADEERAKSIYIFLINLLRKNHFKVGVNPEVKKNYKTLSPMRRLLNHGQLEGHLEYYPMGLKLEFNTPAGRYHFNKMERLSYLARLKFLLIRQKITKYLLASGFQDHTRAQPELAIDRIRQLIETSGHWDGTDLLEWRSPCYSDLKDRDGKILRAGQVKYFYHGQHRRLCRGIIYFGLNNMLWVHTGKHAYENICSSDLFDHKSGLSRRMVLPHSEKIRKAKAVQLKAIASDDFERAIRIRDWIAREQKTLEVLNAQS